MGLLTSTAALVKLKDQNQKRFMRLEKKYR